MKVLLTGLLLSTLFLGATVHAHQAERFGCEVALGLGERSTGLGRRGLLGTVANLEAADEAELLSAGIIPWRERIFVVGSIDEAIRLNWLNARLPALRRRAPATPGWLNGANPARTDPTLTAIDRAFYVEINRRRAIRRDPLQHGLFIIDHDVKLDRLDEGGRAAFLASIPHRPIFELNEDGRMSQLDPALVFRRFNPGRMIVRPGTSPEPTHVVQSGLYSPRYRAVLPLAGLPAVSDVVRNRLAHRGFKFQVSRIDQDVVLEVLQVIADGQDHQVVAAVEGTLHGDTLHLNSASYRPDHAGYAKLLLILLRNDVMKMGAFYVDATKVWEFRRGLGVRLVPRGLEFEPNELKR